MEHRRRGDPVRPGPIRVDIRRWLGALDALAPYLIAVVAVAVARHAFASSYPATVAVVLAAILLGGGTAVMFFRDMSDAHLTWPVAFVLFVVFVPLLALHVRLQSSALAAPVAINLLPLAFTWTGLVIATGLIMGIVYATGAEQPGWAGTIVSPFAVLLGAAPALSLHASRPAVLTATLYVFALAEIVSGLAWLIPERRRWFVVPVVLALTAIVSGRACVTAPHQAPGRILLLIDVVVAVVAGIGALAAPALCRWLARPRDAAGME